MRREQGFRSSIRGLAFACDLCYELKTPPPPSQQLTAVAHLFTPPLAQVALGVGILTLDYFTGPYLSFPILFVFPVCLAAWFLKARWSYILATALPIGRLAIAGFVDRPSPESYILANALIRIAVLAFLAYLVGRIARQTRDLKAQVEGMVTMCAWSRTIEFEGEWLSFEQYLNRRFRLGTTHGICPAEALKHFGAAIQENSPPSTEPLAVQKAPAREGTKSGGKVLVTERTRSATSAVGCAIAASDEH